MNCNSSYSAVNSNKPNILTQAEWIDLAQFSDHSPPESALSYLENALIKARFASKISGLPALADDSGLSVRALAGAPGIYSARYAGDKASDADNIHKLLEAMQHQHDRHACYYCALVWLAHAQDPTPKVAIASWCGEIALEAKGEGGFGYDPIVFMPDLGCTVAELSQVQKSRLSHRAKALQQLLRQFCA